MTDLLKRICTFVRPYIYTIICQFLIISCINSIPNDDDIEERNSPITFSASLSNDENTTDVFHENDALGLYVMIEPVVLEQEYYINNTMLTYTTNNIIPQKDIYFPESKNVCQFTSYFPYQKSAASKGSSEIAVEVQIDQTKNDDARLSDFLVATKCGVTATEEPIKLDFNHKLFCFNIQLEASNGYTPEKLLSANPTVKIKNVYTKGSYDFINDTFTNQHTKADIIPHGTWYIKDNMLCGKSAITIPQTLPSSQTIIELQLGNKVFTCKREDDLTLNSGVYEEHTISLSTTESDIIANFSVSVNDWVHVVQKQTEAVETPNIIDLSNLTFEKVNVYKVMHNEEQVAEIAQEYLCTDQIKAQAIVVYPFRNGKVDLTNGLVTEVIGESQQKHGGKVSWDTANNTLEYTVGTSSPIQRIYISSEGNINTARLSESLQAELVPYILVDTRGTETIEYPIVKIGTQYWTRTIYKATKYTDGSNIEKGNTTVVSSPQYYTHENAYWFYNAAVISTGKIAPTGWRVCNDTDINLLHTYIEGNAAVLKNNNSINNSWENSTFPRTNLTGFNAVATGYYNNSYTGINKAASFWCVDDTTPELANKVFKLSSSDNQLSVSNATTNMALTIKLVKE